MSSYLLVKTLSRADSSTHGLWIGWPCWGWDWGRCRGIGGPMWPWLGQNKEGLRDWWTEVQSEMPGAA